MGCTHTNEKLLSESIEIPENPDFINEQLIKLEKETIEQ